ncbi:putative serine dehydratase domain-containing protein [Tricladium varicosporioides]|nr:putative serine dehydratase domain-containing protein [Hymenoscyphus varicosporioides]
METNSLYPVATKEELQNLYVGRSLKDVATPAAVLDISKLKSNCNRMLEAVDSLNFGWRAHIKTHKTIELTRLQVGSGIGPVNIIVSTIIEAEHVLPLLLEYKNSGRAVNLLYSFPITPAAVPRLSLISKSLGPNGLSLMIDHPDQLQSVVTLYKECSTAPCIFLKIDMGDHRAGVVPRTAACSELIASLLALQTAGTAYFLGLYSHAGHSYASSSRSTALDYLRQEFESLLITATSVHSLIPSHPLILSVGATPTTTSVRNLLSPSESAPEEEKIAINTLNTAIQAIRDEKCSIEIHAGVYPTLDVQQLATHVLPQSLLSWDNLAFTIIAEVASLYPGRGKNGSPEALLGAGSLALGREPCKAYSGWGILTPWNRPGVSSQENGPEDIKGWVVGRVSQEHGILTWGGGSEKAEEVLEIGQKVRIWPNHACIAGAGYGWYLVVDGSKEGREDEIIDVWPRWRGW